MYQKDCQTLYVFDLRSANEGKLFGRGYLIITNGTYNEAVKVLHDGSLKILFYLFIICNSLRLVVI